MQNQVRPFLQFIAVATIFTGCAIDNEKKAELQNQLDISTPICKGARQCDAMWSAARNWVTTHCPTKIHTLTNDYLETYGPTFSADIGCAVSKDPQPDGTYAIRGRISCANLFGCVPAPREALLNFDESVKSIAIHFPAE